MNGRKYLGDGAYVDSDGWHVILTTANGLNETNRIYLDPRCVENLIEYIESLKIED
jgi:hypothetical protein